MYALWDMKVGNRIDWYDTEVEALADVRLALARYGRDVVQSWTLMRHEGEATEMITSGEQLLGLARAAETTREVREHSSS